MTDVIKAKEYYFKLGPDDPWFKNPPEVGDIIPSKDVSSGVLIVTKIQERYDYEAGLRGESIKSCVEIFTIS